MIEIVMFVKKGIVMVELIGFILEWTGKLGVAFVLIGAISRLDLR